ncbi:hypothetical protein I4F81_005840 [Pyropia yezoensis]|uniref:Uncharacterized protein n=1 Tax=Pyropia yezoensis TaxID=2788 RepID=A0ACC3BZG5_PYRYE|nr:hypothetical protein I4F81_005840 [Neopyropia yezoensis]
MASRSTTGGDGGSGGGSSAAGSGGGGGAVTPFVFPPFHAFPPAYTVQPAAATRARQVELWVACILDYCRHYRLFWLGVEGHGGLFRNDAVDRRLSPKDAHFFLSALVSRGGGRWEGTAGGGGAAAAVGGSGSSGAGGGRVLVYWRSPSAWGDLIYKWVEATARNGTVLTLYEVRLGEDARGQEFYDLDVQLACDALAALQAAGKCALFSSDASDDLGVKFL